MVMTMLLYDACQGERHACMLPGSVRAEGHAAIKVTILNLSSNGCRLDSLQHPLPASGRVWVRLADLAPWEGQIVWSHGGAAGCRFADPLHPAVVQRLLGSRLPV